MKATATIRQLQTDFRSVKRRIEQDGETLITNHGEPAYIIKLLRTPAKQSVPPPDYYARLLKRQPKPFLPTMRASFGSMNADHGGGGLRRSQCVGAFVYSAIIF